MWCDTELEYGAEESRSNPEPEKEIWGVLD